MLPCALAVATLGPKAEAGDGAQVVVLVNSRSPDSEAVGAHYVRLRGVPEANVCRVDCSTSEVISRREFGERIRAPLRQFLLRQGLAEPRDDGTLELRVKYLVSTYGIPVKIREDYREATLEELPRPLRERNAAAVDSELCWIALADPPLVGPTENPLYKADAEAPLLFATRLDGPTPAIAKGLVDAALRAEVHGLLGIGYVDARGLTGGPHKQGDDWLLAAGAALARAGLFTRIDRAGAMFPDDMPMPHAAFYFGWYGPRLSGPMAAADFRFPPGAVAYHLHSGSAERLRTDASGWAGPVLARGAAATMGAVYEPYLWGTVDAGEFARLFLAGRTFGESVVRATPTLSWMMTFVGDPLYAPFRSDRVEAALERPENRVWLDVRNALSAAGRAEFGPAVEICSARYPEPLFLELSARILARAGRVVDAAELCRKLAEVADSTYDSVRAHDRAADLLAFAREPAQALDVCLECLRAHGASRHALPVYRRALRLARILRETETEVAVLEGLADGLPGEPLGRLAAGELWLWGLRAECPLPTTPVLPAAERPALDGRGDDAVWQAAVEIPDLVFGVGPRWDSRTSVRLTYDDSALYVLAEVRRPQEPGGALRLAEEMFELMLSPRRGGEQAVRIAVSAEEETETKPGGIVCHVEPMLEQRDGAARQSGWTAELEIPFEVFGRIRPGPKAVWAANFVSRRRFRRFPFRTASGFRSWAPPGADPLAPECAGYLIFK